LKHDLPQNNTLWALLGQLVDMEAETRAPRDEDRAGLGIDNDEKAPGNAAAYKRWRMHDNLKNPGRPIQTSQMFSNKNANFTKVKLHSSIDSYP